MSHVTWYIGCTGSGKTSKAIGDAAALVKEKHVPILVIDSMGCQPLAGVPHFPNWRDAVRQVWKEKKNAAWIPKGPAEVNAVFEMARKLGNVIIILDEASFFLSNRKVPREIEKTFRTHLHVKNLFILNTTQNISEISPLLFQCMGGGELYAFRCISPRTIERLEKEFGLDGEALRSLKRGEYQTVSAEW
jgi:hypothetical protein